MSLNYIPSDEIFRDVPRSVFRHAAFGLTLMAASLGGFGVWATTAPLAAAVIAQGSFVATGKNKIVQHLEGGIVHSIEVSEGDRVEAGETLILLDRTAAQADQRELWLRQLRLEAIEARLLAEYRDDDTLVFPDHLTGPEADPALADILAKQRLAFDVSRSVVRNDAGIIDRAISGLDIRKDGYAAQLETHYRRAENMRSELADRRILEEKGLTRAVEVDALERAVLEIDGQISRLESQVAETDEQIARYEAEREKMFSDRHQIVVQDLQEIQADLDSIREKTRKADAILDRSAITSPVAGTVVRLHYNSPGGVIESGKAIVEILPADSPLTIEIKVPRTDIDTVKPGQTASVRLSALNQRTTPVLEGRVSYVSADSIQDVQNGVPMDIYVANIDVDPLAVDRLSDIELVPGMPAEVLVQSQERTFFQYLVKPITDSMSRAFRES